MSCFVLFDGLNYIILPYAKDYKRVGEGDTGLNTGGMGSISPVNFLDNELKNKIEHEIIKPTINGLIKEKINYVGFIFIGLINVDGQPKVIEYNVRMGDPETQVVLPRIKNDFLDLLISCTNQNLDKIDLEIDSNDPNEIIASIKNFSTDDGKKGVFQQHFRVYGRKGEQCSNTDCNNKVMRMIISNRATFFCKRCQK